MKRKILFLFLTLCTCFMLFMLPVSAYDLSDLTIPESAEALIYGQTGTGRDMTAYRFGTGENIMVVGFALHGYEDNFNRDGLALVYTADLLMDLLDENISTVNNYGWSIYVLPCINLDGLIDGYTCNGPGRCTTTYLNSSGSLVTGKGIDLNRSFPTGWTQYTSARNFNGSTPLASLEAQALAQFIQDVRGSGVNICLDIHGWMSQVITSNGTTSSLYQIFKSAFPSNTYANCNNGAGYFTAYAASLGYAACLFEFPSGVYSMSQFQSSGYPEKFNNCILELAETYGTYQEPEPEPEPDPDPDPEPEPDPDPEPEPAPEPDHDCPSAVFTDVPSESWYHEAVDYTLSQGFFKGMSETTFEPDRSLSRAMLATILYRMAGEETTASNTFIDVPDESWYTAAVAWAAENGIVEGFEDGTFRPTEDVTREQMVTMFYRYAVYSGVDVSLQADLSVYPDVQQVQSYASNAFGWATATGLVEGTTSDSGLILDPQGTSTRAQAATVIMRYQQDILGISEPEEAALASMGMEPNIPADGEDLGGN